MFQLLKCKVPVFEPGCIKPVYEGAFPLKIEANAANGAMVIQYLDQVGQPIATPCKLHIFRPDHEILALGHLDDLIHGGGMCLFFEYLVSDPTAAIDIITESGFFGFVVGNDPFDLGILQADPG
jgi:hypothetical protein